MEQLLVFIETMSVDEKLTWRINGKRPGELFEITWNRRLAPMGWSIRKGFEESVEMFSNADFRIALKYSDIDLRHFEKCLSTNILSQAVFAGMVVEQIKEIFGADIVEKNVNESKMFLSSITELAAAMTGKKAKESPIVKQSTIAAKTHLKSNLLH